MPSNMSNRCYPSIQSQQNGVALDVSVDDALGVEVGQSLQNALTHGCYLLLIQPEDHSNSWQGSKLPDLHI